MNGDGKLDLLVGASVTLIAPANGHSPEEFKKKFADWRAAVQAAGAAANAAGTDEKAQAKAREEYSNVYERRAEFMHEDITGFVWLYLQK